MRRFLNGRLTVVALACLVLPCSTIAQPPEPDIPAVTAARNDLDARQATAAQDYLRKLLDAHHAYQGRLDTALKVAMRDGHLDDATAIKAEQRREANAIAALQHDPIFRGGRGQPELTVVAARWGDGTRWDDVTPLVRGNIKGNRLEVTDHEAEAIHDPAYGVAKTFEIKVSHLGSVITFSGRGSVTIELSAKSAADQPQEAR